MGGEGGDVQRASMGGGMHPGISNCGLFGLNLAFWTSPLLMVMGGEELEPSPQLLGVITSVFILSLWLFHSTEVQFYYVSRAQKRPVTDGFFARLRNSSLLGEAAIYSCLACFSLSHPLWMLPWLL